MKLKTVKDLKIDGKTVLLRAPLNVPIDHGQVQDQLRLKSAIPTIEYLLQHRARIILVGHHSKAKQSLAQVAPALAKLLHHSIQFLPVSVGPKVEKAVAQLEPGQILMLENLRFHPEEEKNDLKFAQRFADLADYYIDDDFTVMHRQHALVAAIAKLLPAAAGFQVQTEVDAIAGELEHPKRPLFAAIGGAKISTKVPLIKNLLSKVNAMLIGGAMANTFMAADGLEVGKSLYEKDQFTTVRAIVKEAARRKVTLILPSDVIVTKRLSRLGRAQVKAAEDVKPGEIIADIGPGTVVRAAESIKQAGTIIWNGPVGVAELPQFAKSSKKLARLISQSKATSIVGGGDTAAFIDKAEIKGFSFVSTGGGASLELMAGQKLPGLEPLIKK